MPIFLQDSTPISNFEDFKKKSGAEARLVTIGRGSGIEVGAQIGGSGIQIGISGLKPKGEISKFTIPLHKVDTATMSTTEYQKAANKNRDALQTLIAIINFVAKQAQAIGQKTMDVVIAVAGFNTKQPPEGTVTKLIEEAKPAIAGKYLTPNIYWRTSSGDGITRNVNFWKLAKGIPSMTIKYQDEADSLAINQEKDFSINFSIMNDTCAVAASELEELEQGDSAVGVVCGSGFNIGIAENFDSTQGKFDKLSNTESGHKKFNYKTDFGKYISPFDLPLIKDGQSLDAKTLKTIIESELSPELIFSGSPNTGAARSIKRQLAHLKALADQGLKLPQGDVFNESRKIVTPALPALKDLNIDKDFKTDKDIEAIVLSSQASPLKDLIIHLYQNFFKRLGSYIGKVTQDNITDTNKLKRINLTGSYLVNALQKLNHDFKEIFETAFSAAIGKSKEQVKFTYLGRDQMDGLVDLLQTKAASARVGAYLRPREAA